MSTASCSTLLVAAVNTETAKSEVMRGEAREGKRVRTLSCAQSQPWQASGGGTARQVGTRGDTAADLEDWERVPGLSLVRHLRTQGRKLMDGRPKRAPVSKRVLSRKIDRKATQPRTWRAWSGCRGCAWVKAVGPSKKLTVRVHKERQE